MRSIPLWGKLLGAVGVVAAACVGLTFVPTGEVAYAPIAPIDLDGRVAVAGTPVEPLAGRVYLVGVTERRVNFLQRLLLDVGDPDIDFGPEPDDPTPSGPSARDVDSMAEAKRVAAAVAFDLVDPGSVRYAGTGATVAAVAPSSPASGALEPGDIIVRVDDATGAAVDTSVEVGRLIGRAAPGSVVRLGIQRGGVGAVEQVRTVAAEGLIPGQRSRIGVSLSTIGLRIALPRDVTINSGEVVGPSAALAFALYLYDALDERADLLRGRQVVASGALAPDGQVLPVGRIRQKAIAAQAANRDVLLVPAANAAEAREAIAERCDGDPSCLRVIPVVSVFEAVELLALSDAELDARLAGETALAAP